MILPQWNLVTSELGKGLCQYKDPKIVIRKKGMEDKPHKSDYKCKERLIKERTNKMGTRKES